MNKQVGLIGIARCGTTLLGHLLRYFPEARSVEWGREHAIPFEKGKVKLTEDQERNVWVWRNPHMLAAQYTTYFQETVHCYDHLIAIVRDPRDAWVSHPVSCPDKYFYTAPEHLLRSYRNLRELREAQGNLMIVLYEELCMDPVSVLADIREFVGFGPIREEWPEFYHHTDSYSMRKHLKPRLSTESIGAHEREPAKRNKELVEHPDFNDLFGFYQWVCGGGRLFQTGGVA